MAHEQFFFSQDVQDDIIILTETEHHHLSRVLRKRIGDEVWVTNGKGIAFQTCIKQIETDKTYLSIQETYPKFGESMNRVTLAAGIIKPAHWEFLLEKSVELGVYDIYPIISRYTIKTNFKMDRAKKIILSAAKQSGRSRVPNLYEPLPFENFVNKEFKELTYICDNQDDYPMLSNCEEDQNHVVLIGPEGGFSPEEVKLAIKNNFLPVSLGPRRLRAETAAIMAVNRLVL